MIYPNGNDRDARLLPAPNQELDAYPASLAPARASRQEPARDYVAHGMADNPLHDAWFIIRRYKWLLLALPVVTTLLAWWWSTQQTPVYTASTTLEVLGVNDKLFGFGKEKYDPNGGLEYTIESYIQTQIRIIQSDFILEKAAQALNYQTRPEYTQWKTRFGLTEKLGFRKGRPTPRERMLDSIQRRLSIEVLGLTRILALSYESEDPRDAADYLNTLTEAYIDQAVHANVSGTAAASSYLKNQLDAAKARLEASDNALQEFAARTGLNFADESENLAEAGLRQIQVELSHAEVDRIAKQSRLESAQNVSPDTLPDVLADVGLRDLRTRLMEIRRNHAELSATLTAENPKVQKVQAQVDELTRDFEQQKSNVVQRIRNEFVAAERREALIRARYDAQRSVITAQTGQTARYHVLKLEVEANRAMYDALLQKMREASMMSASRQSGVRVLDYAVVPTVASKPNTLFHTVAGFGGGAMFALIFTLVRLRLDQTVKRPGESQGALSLPELGIIPNCRGRNLPLIAWEDRISPVAESFRSAATSIMFAGAADHPRTVVFTSANPGEGKSTVISNVAISWALRRKRVLLVDADTRRPSLHGFFGITQDEGLGALLSSEDPITDTVLSRYIQPTQVPGLFLLPAGLCGPEVANLLDSDRMRQLLQQVRRHYDVVLIDTPPMLQMPDARIIGRLADRVILVLRSGQTPRSAAIFAVQRFAEDGTPVLGSILNSFDISSAGYLYRGADRTSRS